MTRRTGRTCTLACLAVLTITSVSPPPAWSMRDDEPPRAITGTAVTEDGSPISGTVVRLRKTITGMLVEAVTTEDTGAFVFAGLEAGHYVLELVGAGGMLLGTTTVYVAPNVVAVTGVTVTARRPTRRRMGAAFWGTKDFFGSALGGITLAAAGVGVTAGIVATRGDASPKR